MQKKERMWKATREKHQITYEGKLIRIAKDFSTETLKVSGAWNGVFQILKENNCQLRLLYSEKLTFIFERELRTYHDKQKLIQFLATKSALQKILKESCTHKMKTNATMNI
jgi:hypothetical protein